VRSVSARSHNLPAQITSFVGREQEIGELCEALSSARLVTLVAAGGSGKTRLALRVAEELVDSYEGVFFVALAPLAQPDLIGARVLEAMGFVAPGTTPQELETAVADRIGDRRLLLVIDNCEHLVDACGRLVSEPAPERYRRRRSHGASTTRCTSSSAKDARPTPATTPSRRAWSGATTSSPPRRRRCCVAPPCSPAAGRWRRPRRSAAENPSALVVSRTC
jgi:hypothetical protein